MGREEHDAMAIQTWEYQVVDGRLAEDRLNVLGREGWELVAVTDSLTYLKRPILGFKERITLEQREKYARLRGESLKG